MLVDLDNNLYVIDRRTHEHKVKFIDTTNKIVFAEGTENADIKATITTKIESELINSETIQELGGFYYGTHDITVTIKDLP